MQGHIADAFKFWATGQGVQAGRVIYSHLRQDERPAWASGILRVVLDKVPSVPEAEKVVRAASARSTWPRARELFLRVRKATLRATEGLPLNCLLLAENVAKVTFNATGLPGAFDQDSGWWVVQCALDVTRIIDDPSFTERVWRAVAQSPQTGPDNDATPAAGSS